jgi:hypothetical protein
MGQVISRYRYSASQRRSFMGKFLLHYRNSVSQRLVKSPSTTHRYEGSQRRSFMGLSASKGSRWDASQRSLMGRINLENDNWYQTIRSRLETVDICAASGIIILLAVIILVLVVLSVSRYWRSRRHGKVREGRVDEKSGLDMEMQGNDIA